MSWNARCIGMGAILRERRRVAKANDKGPETPQQRRERLLRLRREHAPKQSNRPPGFYNEEGKANG